MIVCDGRLRNCVDCTEAKYTLGWRISKQFRVFFSFVIGQAYQSTRDADEDDWIDEDDNLIASCIIGIHSIIFICVQNSSINPTKQKL